MATSQKVVATLFHEEYSKTYNLVILVGQQAIRYAIVDSRNHNLLVICHHPIPDDSNLQQVLNNWLVEEEILQAGFNQTEVFIWNSQLTLIPKALWEEGMEQQVLERVLGKIDGRCHAHLFYEDQIVAAYALPAKLEDWFFDHFPNATIKHANIPLLNHYRQLNAFNGKSKVYAHFSPNLLEISVIKDGALVFHNHFAYESKEDVAYFTLLIYDQLELDRQATPLILAGGILQDSAVYQLLYKYVGELQFARLPEKLVVNENEFEAIHKHDFVNLLSSVR